MKKTATEHEGDHHDLLIRSVTVLAEARADIEEIRSGTQSHLENHEARIRGIENRNIRLDPMLENCKVMWEEWQQFKAILAAREARARIWLGLAGGLGGGAALAAEAACGTFLSSSSEMAHPAGVDQVFPGYRPRPWQKPGWLRERLKELLYSLLSWPYLIGLALTAFFIVRPDTITLQALLGGWGLAFAQREFANYLAAKLQR